MSGTSQCCPWCGERQKGRAKKEAARRGDRTTAGWQKWWGGGTVRLGAATGGDDVVLYSYENRISHFVRGLKVLLFPDLWPTPEQQKRRLYMVLLVAGRAAVEGGNSRPNCDQLSAPS
jgi:hypothetical protein